MLKPSTFFLLLLSLMAHCERPVKKQVPLKDTVLPLEHRFDRNLQSYAYTIENLPPVKGLTAYKASDCGICHQNHYNEWKQSTHAFALNDLQFIAEASKKNSPEWICLNCHIPLQNQRRVKVTGLKNGDVMRPQTVANPDFDEKLQKEGVTCAACHVRKVNEKESVVIGPLGTGNAPHAVKKDPEHLRNICARCHDPKGERITPDLVCWFETQKELFNARKTVHDTFGSYKDCVDCHMPLVKRNISAYYTHLPAQNNHRHTFTGAGIPKYYRGYNFQSNKDFVPGVDIQTQYKFLTDTIRIETSITNSRAGHMIPTADPERNLLIISESLSDSGDILERKTHRIGQKWQWSPAVKLDDNRIYMGETRIINLTLKKNSTHEPGSLRKIRTYVLHVRLNTKNAAYAMKVAPLLGGYIDNVESKMAQLPRLYPMARYVFHEEFYVDTQKRVISNAEQLRKMSMNESEIPVTKRAY